MDKRCLNTEMRSSTIGKSIPATKRSLKFNLKRCFSKTTSTGLQMTKFYYQILLGYHHQLINSKVCIMCSLRKIRLVKRLWLKTISTLVPFQGRNYKKLLSDGLKTKLNSSKVKETITLLRLLNFQMTMIHCSVLSTKIKFLFPQSQPKIFWIRKRWKLLINLENLWKCLKSVMLTAIVRRSRKKIHRNLA